ncbi:hypothetical protein BGX29_005362, partial [Mortierella sp. GBA35]
MSFIYNYFVGDNSTPSEKENAAALKSLINDHKATLKTEIKQYETDYKQTLKDAEAEYKRAKKQAAETMYRSSIDAVKREIDIITATDEYANSDAKTKAKIAQFQTWMGCAAHKCFGEEAQETVTEKDPPSYSDDKTASGSISYPN